MKVISQKFLTEIIEEINNYFQLRLNNYIENKIDEISGAEFKLIMPNSYTIEFRKDKNNWVVYIYRKGEMKWRLHLMHEGISELLEENMSPPLIWEFVKWLVDGVEQKLDRLFFQYKKTIKEYEEFKTKNEIYNEYCVFIVAEKLKDQS